MKFVPDSDTPHYPKTYLNGHLELARVPSGKGDVFRAKWLDSFGQTLATGQWGESEDMAARSLALAMRHLGQNLITSSEELIEGTEDEEGVDKSNSP